MDILKYLKEVKDCFFEKEWTDNPGPFCIWKIKYRTIEDIIDVIKHQISEEKHIAFNDHPNLEDILQQIKHIQELLILNNSCDSDQDGLRKILLDEVYVDFKRNK